MPMAEQLSKKEWSEPELIILVRSNPEEAVLVQCKSSAGSKDGPVYGVTSCTSKGILYCNMPCDYPEVS